MIFQTFNNMIFSLYLFGLSHNIQSFTLATNLDNTTKLLCTSRSPVMDVEPKGHNFEVGEMESQMIHYQPRKIFASSFHFL